MGKPQDEAGLWDEDPVIRPLRAPGTAAELAGLEEFVAAYRTEFDRGSWGRFASRFGLGATTIVTTLALTGGVAAAYTQSLPDPVQRFAHEVLGPVGVPAAPPEMGSAEASERSEAQAPTTLSAPGTQDPGSADQGASSVPPNDAGSSEETTQQVPAPTPTLDPPPLVVGGAEGPTPSAITDASPAVPRSAPGSLSLTTPSRAVSVGTTVALSGVLLSREGEPLQNRRIFLVGRSPGGKWDRLAAGRTGADGGVTLESPGLERNTKFRLAASRTVRSDVVRVAVIPVLEVSSRTDGAATSITVVARGGSPGDRITLFRLQGGRLTKSGTDVLGPENSVTFMVATPSRIVRGVVRIQATAKHARGQAWFRIAGKSAASSVPSRGGSAEAPDGAEEGRLGVTPGHGERPLSSQ